MKKMQIINEALLMLLTVGIIFAVLYFYLNPEETGRIVGKIINGYEEARYK